MLFGRDEQLRMFISSVMSGDELADERATVAATLDDLDALEPWMWERQGVAGPRDARDFCVFCAQTSDGLILIVGSTLSPTTQDEFEAARAEGVPRFVFLKRRGDRDAEAQAFIDDIRQDGHVTASFDSPEDLAAKVSDAVLAYYNESWRFHFLAKKRGVDFTGPGPEFGVGPYPTGDDSGVDADLRGDFQDVVAAVDELPPLERTLAAGHLLQEATTMRVGVIADELLERIDLDVEGLTGEDQGWMLNAQGLAEALLGRHDEAVTRFRDMREIGEDLGDDRLVATALQNLGVLAFESSPGEAGELWAEAEAIVRSYGDDHQAVQLQLSEINVALSNGDIDQAVRLLDEVEEVVRPWGGHLLASVNGTRGIIASRRGEYERAERLFRRTLQSARRREDPRDATLAWQNLAATASDDGRLRTAVDRLGRAISIADAIGWDGKLAELHRSCGSVLFTMGDAGAAVNHLSRSCDQYERAGAAVLRARVEADLGAALAADERFDEAEERLTRALGPLVASGDTEWEAHVLANLSAVAEVDGDHERALGHLNRAIGTLGDDLPAFASELLWSAARVASLRRSTRERAVDFLRRRIDLSESHGTPRDAAERTRGAAHLMAETDLELARSFFEEAVARAESLDSRPLLCDVHTDFGVALAEAMELEAAWDSFQEARTLAADVADVPRQQRAVSNLGETARRDGDLDAAERLTREALQLAEETDDEVGLLEAKAQLALVLQDRERWAESRAEYEAVLGSDAATPLIRARAWTGQGNVAFLKGAFSDAITAYDRARALYRRRSPEDYVGILGAMLESRLAQGDRSLRTHVQRLVDRAQELRVEEVAAYSLGRCGNQALTRGRRDDAVELYAVACLLGGQAHRDDPDHLLGGMSAPLLCMAVHLQDDPSDWEPILADVADCLVDDYSVPRAAADSLTELVQEAVEVAITQSGLGNSLAD